MALNTTYLNLATQIVPDLPGAEQDVIMFYLFRAARQFCQDAEVFEQTVTDTLAADDDEYSITVTDAQCKRIKRVRFLDGSVEVAKDYFDGREIDPDHFVLQRNSGTGADEILFDTAATPNSAEAGFTLVVLAAYVPHVGVDILPDNFLTQWADAIRYGAMVEMLSLPDRPWSSAVLLQDYKARYADAVARGRFEEIHANKSVSKLMVAPSFL